MAAGMNPVKWIFRVISDTIVFDSPAEKDTLEQGMINDYQSFLNKFPRIAKILTNSWVVFLMYFSEPFAKRKYWDVQFGDTEQIDSNHQNEIDFDE